VVEQAIAALTRFFAPSRATHSKPILWVGAGASAAAGYPTLWQLEEKVRAELPGTDQTGFALIDAYIAEWSPTDLDNLLETHLGAPRKPAGLHASLARLAGAGVFASIFTTNYDELIEDSLKAEGIHAITQVLEQNFKLQARAEVQVLKLHGSRTDWASVILSGDSYRRFHDDYPLLKNQLDLNLRTHPLLFVGCSMQDPRILEWLRALSDDERRGLYAARVLITERDWSRIPAADQALLTSANIKPVKVAGFDDIAAVLAGLARHLAPLPVQELVFDVAPAADTWITIGPTPESAPHAAPNPLDDRAFVADLVALREKASRPIRTGVPGAALAESALRAVARRIGARLTEVLLSDEARAGVARRIHQNGARGRARLTIRVAGSGDACDRALAVPWELLTPEPSAFAVADGQLDVVREAVSDGAPGLEAPTDALSLTVSIAAPDDASALAYEKEAFRLYQSLAPLGHRVAFTDLGDLDDLVRTVAAARSTAIHFSGHGLPGQLVFEDEYGLAVLVPVGELVKSLNVHLVEAGKSKPFPRLFYLASCYGASGDPDGGGARDDGSRSDDERHAREVGAALGEGPSTAATLHRSGFVQVLGYFGPISDALSTRAEEVFYGALGQGKTTLQAVAEARESLGKEIALGDDKASFPFAWTQLALYHRGPDLPLARPVQGGPAPLPVRFERTEVQVSGLPVLEHGFMGRRSLQHVVRRKVMKEGRRLLVLQGLGGLGKTALASHLVSRVFADEPADVLILPCGYLDPKASDPASTMWQWAEEHGRIHGLAGWEASTKALREKDPTPAEGFEQAVRMLRKVRSRLVVYADNLETLQDGPRNEDPRALGEFLPAGAACWLALERLSKEGLVLVSTRYRWRGLDPAALVAIEPMKPADVRRMIETFEFLGRMLHQVQGRIAAMADGHPRTVEYLDRLVGDWLRDNDDEPKDWWAEVVEPLLPRNAEAITADLLLDALWARLSEEARAHARALTVLRRPAPRVVVDALGSKGTTGELIRAGVVTLFREQSVGEDKSVRWVQRWWMHGLMVRFACENVMEAERWAAHEVAGAAYEAWLKEPGARWGDHEEGIFHWHSVRQGDRAWSLLGPYAVWLREHAQYRQSLGLLESSEAAGTTGERLSVALMLVAQMKRRLGERSAEVGVLLDRAWGLAESDRQRGSVLSEKGGFLQQQGKHGDAEAQLRQALALLQVSLGAEDPVYGVALHELGGILREQGRRGEAEVLLRQALAIFEKTHGTGDRLYGETLGHLGRVLRDRGSYGEAEALLRQALAITKTALGVEHPSYGEALHALATVLTETDKCDEAESLLRESIAIDERVLGADHPSYGDSLNEPTLFTPRLERCAQVCPQVCS
jgi:tetratricopeptide (TPR) repeat protein